MSRPLPIDALLPAIVERLSTGSRLVLRAPPGAGKTTRVPAALLDAGLAGEREVVVLEPRRIAARAAAEFVARERGGAVGAEVGYRVRFEQRGGAATRLWFVTEGVLGRQLARDPFLEPVGLIVLDEFHERHLPGDIALGVVRELQETVRPDLKLVVMSATLETERLAAYLGGCPVLTSSGQAYPVEISYAAGGDDRPLTARVVSAVTRLLDALAGDVLVFLPGAAEIRRGAVALAPLAAARDVSVLPLHGELPLDAQWQALRAGPRRKIVLATNVAETALTVEGVTAVVDSGLARVARFDARRGLNGLAVAPISRAAADQRAGRAGRLAPGRCLRLWPRDMHVHRLAHETPEIARLDLTATVLELRAWGLTDLQRFHWLDAPPAAALRRAEDLLQLLGAVDQGGALTAIGRRMLALPVAPRLARLLIEAADAGCAGSGALLAALASERDISVAARAFGGRADWHPTGPSDLLLRAGLFRDAAVRHFAAGACEALGLEPRTVRAVDRTCRHLIRLVGADDAATPDPEVLLRCVLAGFPDRVARRRARGSPRAVMVGGTGVVLAEPSVVREAELFVAVDVDAGPRQPRAEARVTLASAVRREWLERLFPTAVQTMRDLAFDVDRQRVVARTRYLYRDLVLDESISTEVDGAAAGPVLAAALRDDPHVVSGDAAVAAVLERLRFLRRWVPELDLPADLDALVAAAALDCCAGCASLADLRARDVAGALCERLTPVQRAALARDAPAAIELPSGRRANIRYVADGAPVVAARIQELFGLGTTPRLGRGRAPLVIELLAPNLRAVQVTDDLTSFWRTVYGELRRRLRARYPKHDWPEDPLVARPSRTGLRARGG
jgi:ATP-dependent helicase HrpB